MMTTPRLAAIAASASAASLLLWASASAGAFSWRAPARASWLETWSANPAEAAHSASRADGGAGRLALVVVGLTGAGKSSTANTLCGRVPRKFAVGDAASSVTAAASHRDYFFAERAWRVIDTPGLGDTHRPPADVAAELRAVAALAPAGALFVVVVPHGRVTGAQEAALAELAALFGAGLPAAAIVAVTRATAADASRSLLSREALLEDLAALPRAHALRALVDAAGGRVIAVDNRLEPHRTVSRLAVHQAALELLASRGGRTFDVADAVAAAAAAGGAALPVRPAAAAAAAARAHDGDAAALDALGAVELGHAVLRVERTPGSHRVRIVIEGDAQQRQ
jgi:hypothetical protein